MKRNVIRRIVGGLSLTSAMFVFQACYGTPGDFGEDLYLEGDVISKTTGLPLEGIHISVDKQLQYEVTNKNGHFSFYTEKMDSLKLHFSDIDNKTYIKKDTVLTNISKDRISITIELEEVE